MPKIVPPAGFETVLNAVGQHPDGASIDLIQSVLGEAMARRTLQRRLNELRELCQETEKLHAAAERLLRDLSQQIEQTRQFLSRPVVERRKKPR